MYIVDPGVPDVPDDPSYLSYANGLAQGIFMRAPGPDPRITHTPNDFENNTFEAAAPVLLSRVWPHVNVSFPDFGHPNAVQYWGGEIQRWFESGGWSSGLWIDVSGRLLCLRMA